MVKSPLFHLPTRTTQNNSFHCQRRSVILFLPAFQGISEHQTALLTVTGPPTLRSPLRPEHDEDSILIREAGCKCHFPRLPAPRLRHGCVLRQLHIYSDRPILGFLNCPILAFFLQRDRLDRTQCFPVAAHGCCMPHENSGRNALPISAHVPEAHAVKVSCKNSRDCDSATRLS